MRKGKHVKMSVCYIVHGEKFCGLYKQISPNGGETILVCCFP